MLWAMRLRSLVFRGERRQLSREAASYLAAADAEALLEAPAPEQPSAIIEHQ
jgi:hypothetical protein